MKNKRCEECVCINGKRSNNNKTKVEEEVCIKPLHNFLTKNSIKCFCSWCILVFLINSNTPSQPTHTQKISVLNRIKEFEKNKKKISKSEIINFYHINSRNILLDSKINKHFLFPDVSIILLMYNQANIIHTSLRSIQNQSLKNIEIIIIDDCSIDNSTSIIKKYLNEDKRITLIEHESNEGKIKSRSEGIKLAKGKYITVVDGDDALIHRNILYNSFKIGILGNLDIVEFKIAKYNKEKFLGILTNYDYIKNVENNIIYQPELRTKFIIRNDNPSIRGTLNRNLCGKLIKNEVFKQVLSNIGKKYTDDYIMIYEDTIMAISLLQIANSYYLMKERGYYYNRDTNRNKFSENIETNIKKCKINKNIVKDIDQAKYLNFLLEHTKDNYIERQLIYYEIKSMDYWEGFQQKIGNHFNLFYEIFDKILKIRFLKRKQIDKIIFIKNRLLAKEKYIKQHLNNSI